MDTDCGSAPTERIHQIHVMIASTGIILSEASPGEIVRFSNEPRTTVNGN